MPYFYGIDVYYLILVVPALLIAMWAQANVTGTFKKYSKIYSASGMTGAQAAEAILRRNGIHDVRVEPVAGNLTDHYDPRDGVIRLSEPVYGSSSVAAVGVAAHEAGHAVQHHTAYAPLAIRNFIIPVSRFGSTLAMPVFLLGIIFSFDLLMTIGILLFAAAVLFQVVTLPVEFDASRRAVAVLRDSRVLGIQELESTKKVLFAAALTYVAALLVSLMNLLRLLLLANNRRRR